LIAVANKGNLETELTYRSNPKSLPTVRCVCGFRILVVPDLKAMNRAIKNHLTKHKKAHTDSVRLAFIEASLAEQVLIVASKMSLPK
jgi:DNA-directed RNA polymerase subunit RPC12/RpoP